MLNYFIDGEKGKRLIKIMSLLFSGLILFCNNHSVLSRVKPVLTTTFLQRPAGTCLNDIITSNITSINDHFWTTTSVFGSQGRSLYSGLTVLIFWPFFVFRAWVITFSRSESSVGSSRRVFLPSSRVHWV